MKTHEEMSKKGINSNISICCENGWLVITNKKNLNSNEKGEVKNEDNS